MLPEPVKDMAGPKTDTCWNLHGQAIDEVLPSFLIYIMIECHSDEYDHETNEEVEIEENEEDGDSDCDE